ncbi:right-handed parallel beta-helix repeat-containing protein [Shewanella sp. FJAT-52076]|uniref:right-handed parallel beta-helix repeat-containing protein n=1 Tax=Shewanella sp. FJAT-52076 TaxID=2864202 RepID=UPI001C65D086|nr:right-handed parallel beta-helix repeat-containing protein [Shewanella sp. FJAT-52076]QYJ74035.1 right-handed parallel beta-helix repeat-containing protein [Shewanella sp. FJAT-52076]
MKHLRVVILWVSVLVMPNLHAYDFAEYCTFTKGEADCSSELMMLMDIASETNEPIYLGANNIFRIDSVDTSAHLISGISIIGDKTSVIKTDRFFLRDIDNLKISGVKIEGINVSIGSNTQDTAMISFGGSPGMPNAKNITLVNNFFSQSAEDILNIRSASNVVVSNNEFRLAGLAMRSTISESNGVYDERPKGSAIGMLNVDDVLVSDNRIFESKKTGIFVDSLNHTSKNISIFNNHIDLLSFSNPTWRYGLKGGAGIYFVQGSNFSNISVTGNAIYNAKMNALRLNGNKVIARNNRVDMDDTCSFIPENVDKAILNSIAIKSHFIDDAIIRDNCIANYSVGVHLESWGEIKDVTVDKNKVFSPNSGVVVEHKYGGVYNNVRVVNNAIYGSKTNGYVFRSALPSTGNMLVGNSLVNNQVQNPSGINSGGPMVFIQNQTDFYYENNWIEGGNTSINWNFLVIENVDNSIFKRSSFKLNSTADKNSAGIYIKSGSDNNYFDRINFYQFSQGIHDFGVSNKFSLVKYIGE